MNRCAYGLFPFVLLSRRSGRENVVRGIYTAAMGMLVDQAIVDNASNNLANVDTTGFKRTFSVRSYLQHEILRIEARRSTKTDAFRYARARGDVG